MTAPFDGVVLLAHGARDQRWFEPLLRLRANVAERVGPRPVALSFLEFAPPSFVDAAGQLHGAGARSVLVIPVFLSNGGHVANDVPRLLASAEERYPDLAFTLAGAIGEEPEVAAGMADAVARLARTPG